MEGENEVDLKGYPNYVGHECLIKIMEQMEKNICSFRIGNSIGTGFFCKIPFPDENNMLKVFLTNNHLINDKLLYKQDFTISIKSKIYENKKINLNDRLKYTNIEYDTTIIEMKEQDYIGDNYLELDDDILKDIINSEYNNDKYLEKTLYIIQYPLGKLSLALGTLEKIDEQKQHCFYHKCNTKNGSSGSPILTLNNKIIGIHSSGIKIDFIYNKGIFLNYPIKDFIELNFGNKNKEAEEAALKEFNNFFKLDIKDNKIEKLDLGGKIEYNYYLNELTKIKFKNLKELILNYSVSNLDIFEQIKFDKLEILDLRINAIKDLTPLSKVKYNNLKQLILFSNDISDLKGLDNAKFPQLEILDLGCNKIADISLLQKMNFKNLITLNLNNNKIEVIDGLVKANFKMLKSLDLSDNNISDVKQFGKIIIFQKLETLRVRGRKLDEKNYEEIYSFLKAKYNNINIW